MGAHFVSFWNASLYHKVSMFENKTNNVTYQIYLDNDRNVFDLIGMNSYTQELDMFISHPPKKVLGVWGARSVGKSHSLIE